MGIFSFGYICQRLECPHPAGSLRPGHRAKLHFPVPLVVRYDHRIWAEVI